MRKGVYLRIIDYLLELQKNKLFLPLDGAGNDVNGVRNASFYVNIVTRKCVRCNNSGLNKLHYRNISQSSLYKTFL